MKQLKAKIRENKRIAEGFHSIRVESSYLAKNIKPGQFVEVRCSEELDPLLRRPLGVHRILKSGIELLYEVVGKGTAILSQKKPGEFLDVIGPLGNGFDIKRKTIHDPVRSEAKPPRKGRTTILAAGGIGVAPLVALAEHLGYRVPAFAKATAGRQATGYRVEKIIVLIGAKTKRHILCENEFKKLGSKVLVATEDGSAGYKGLVTDLLKRIFFNNPTIQRSNHSTIYACGPVGMLKEVAAIARERKVPCQVSLEERMACGVGVCLGCPVKVRTKYEIRAPRYEYKMVCKDGPVFNAEEIVW